MIYCRWSDSFNEWFTENYYIGSHYIKLDRTWLFLQLLENKMGIGFMPLRMAKPLLASGDFISLDYEHRKTAPLEENYIIYNRKQEERVLPVCNAIISYIKI